MYYRGRRIRSNSRYTSSLQVSNAIIYTETGNPLKMHFRLSLIIIRAFVGVNYSLCYFDNHYSTGELFPPIPMFRLKIYSRTERKLNCLPLRGQV